MKKVLAAMLLVLTLSVSADVAFGEDVLSPGHKMPGTVQHVTWVDYLRTLWIELVSF